MLSWLFCVVILTCGVFVDAAKSFGVKERREMSVIAVTTAIILLTVIA